MKRMLDHLDEMRGREDAGGKVAGGRLERLEHAIDAIALEVERVGEGQRFLTKLFADRSPDPPLPNRSPERGRVITPH